jgi:hypothetical protein
MNRIRLRDKCGRTSLRRTLPVVIAGALTCTLLCGCGEIGGYTNQSLFPDHIRTVCLEMFDNQTFRRDIEYELSDALAKRIEADTPYKIVSDKGRADTLISGRIVAADEFGLTTERQLGGILEKELQLRAVVTWKNLDTGQFLIESRTVSASATYSPYQNQDFKYASTLAANNMARKIVELMEKKW